MKTKRLKPTATERRALALQASLQCVQDYIETEHGEYAELQDRREELTEKLAKLKPRCRDLSLFVPEEPDPEEERAKLERRTRLWWSFETIGGKVVAEGRITQLRYDKKRPAIRLCGIHNDGCAQGGETHWFVLRDKAKAEVFRNRVGKKMCVGTADTVCMRPTWLAAKQGLKKIWEKRRKRKEAKNAN